MTETNGAFKAVSADPEQAYRESIEQLREEGMAPDELKFQFNLTRLFRSLKEAFMSG